MLLRRAWLQLDHSTPQLLPDTVSVQMRQLNFCLSAMQSPITHFTFYNGTAAPSGYFNNSFGCNPLPSSGSVQQSDLHSSNQSLCGCSRHNRYPGLYANSRSNQQHQLDLQHGSSSLCSARSHWNSAHSSTRSYKPILRIRSRVVRRLQLGR